MRWNSFRCTEFIAKVFDASFLNLQTRLVAYYFTAKVAHHLGASTAALRGWLNSILPALLDPKEEH
jgi:hypothetical protein